MIKLIFALALPCAVFGQVAFDRNCDQFATGTQQNFDSSQYLGRWHELARFDTNFLKGGDCVTATYDMNPNGTIQVLNGIKFLSTGESHLTEGFAYEKDPELHDGKLVLKFPTSPEIRYWILETDYKRYSVVWSCYDIGSISLQYLWFLARTTTIDEDTEKAILNVVAENRLEIDQMRITENSDEKCEW